jgi:hypothetical protein
MDFRRGLFPGLPTRLMQETEGFQHEVGRSMVLESVSVTVDLALSVSVEQLGYQTLMVRMQVVGEVVMFGIAARESWWRCNYWNSSGTWDHAHEEKGVHENEKNEGLDGGQIEVLLKKRIGHISLAQKCAHLR